jgi:hypothetical protein
MDLSEAFTTGGEPARGADLPELTVFDRCDSPGCSSQAYLRAQLASGLQLVFCGHHGRAVSPKLLGQGAIIRDDSHLLVEDRRLSQA